MSSTLRWPQSPTRSSISSRSCSPPARGVPQKAASDLYKTHSSNGGAISLLLNAGSFADFIDLTKYLGTVQRADRLGSQ